MMEINQVVVNKLPSSCSECGWTKSLLTSNLQCAFNMMNIDCDPFEARSSWCPLVVDEVCEWIPVSERLPEMHEIVLVVSGGVTTARRKIDIIRGYCWVEIDNMELGGVTHWQHLPNPPKDGE